MLYKINVAVVKLRNRPDPAAPNPAGLILMSDLIDKMSDAGNGWWQVKIVTQGSVVRVGYIQSSLLAGIDPPTPSPDINKEEFYRQLNFSARAHETNSDYLYAVAFIESGVRNIASKTSSAFGPFQFLKTTWDDMVSRYGGETGVTSTDFVDPAAQCVFAAIYTHDSQKVLFSVLSRMPSACELYLAHLLGTGAASTVLRADPGGSIEVPLKIFYKGTQKGEAFAQTVIGANSGLLKTGPNVRTVNEVITEVASRLQMGLQEAAQLRGKIGPSLSDLPGSPAGDPPWLATAAGELGTQQSTTPAGSNPKIVQYFASTSMGPASDANAWCAAFVSWCMENCGNPKIVAGNLHSARAADWSKWGYSVGRPARGAVAVLRPLVPRSSGHVGFVVGEDTTKVELLAGNQGDQNGVDSVCQKLFSKDDVIQYRWMDWS